MSPSISKPRCAWVNDSALYQNYHDHEWGIPIYQDRLLFEFLILEGMQAGLSWLTVLKKRTHYRVVFDQFEISKMAYYDTAKINELLNDPGIIRNRLKIHAAISNAQALLRMQQAGLSFSAYIWSFVDGTVIRNHWQHKEHVPITSTISDALAKDLKKRGFKFVGTTICYAFMQAVGMVNDHTQDCHCYSKAPLM